MKRQIQKLVIFSEDTIYQHDNSFMVRNPLVILYSEFAKYMEQVVISGPTTEVPLDVAHYTDIEQDQLIFSPRTYYGSVEEFFKKLPTAIGPTLKNIRDNVQQADLVMIRLPSPIGYIAYREARRQGKPVLLYVAGDIRSVAREGQKYRGWRRPLSELVAYTYTRLTERMARQTLVFVAGSKLYAWLKPHAKRCVPFLPSLIREDDLSQEPGISLTLGDRITLIYSGRLVPVKGLRYLLEAMRLLDQRGISCHTTFVGEGYQKEELTTLAEDLGLSDRVCFKGYVPFGKPLLDLYREADIYVLPSLSEGVPKVVFEAMACGLPIIATRVGGITDIVKDRKTGLLVDPRSPEQIAQAIERLVMDHVLRREIIQNGFGFAREHTVEKQAAKMWKEAQDFFALENG